MGSARPAIYTLHALYARVDAAPRRQAPNHAPKRVLSALVFAAHWRIGTDPDLQDLHLRAGAGCRCAAALLRVLVRQCQIACLLEEGGGLACTW